MADQWQVQLDDDWVAHSATLVTQSPRRAVILHGPPGIGKSTSIQAIRAHLLANGYQAIDIHGSVGLKDSPLAAIAMALANQPINPQLGVAEKINQLLTLVAPARFRHALFVDDGHHLDPASAALVAQLVRVYGLPCLITCRGQRSLPEPLIQLGQEHLAVEISAEPLTPQSATDLVARSSLRPLNPDALQLLLDKTAGNPMLLRSLLASLTAQNQASATHPATASDLLLPPQLQHQVANWLDGLSPSARELACTLAAGGALPRNQFSSAQPYLELEAAGLAKSSDGLVATLAYPIYHDLILSLIGPAARKKYRLAAVEILRANQNPEAQFQATRVLAETDEPPPTADLAQAADYAFNQNKHRDAIALSSKAMLLAKARNEPAPGAAMGTRAAALSATGQMEQADAAFAEALAACTTDTEIAVVASHAGTHWAVRRLQPAIAAQIVGAALERVTDRSAARYLTADIGKWLIGKVAIQDLLEVDQSDDPQVAANILMWRLRTLITDGQFELVKASIAQAHALFAVHPEAMRNGEEISRFATCVVAFFCGDAAQVQQLLRHGRADYLSDGFGMWGYVEALTAYHRGDLETALQIADASADLLRWRDFVGALGPSIALAASAAAGLGRTAEARARLESLGDYQRLHIMTALHAIEAEAWLLAGQGDSVAAGKLLAEFTQYATTQACHSFTAMTAHLAVRFGEPHGVKPVLEECRDYVESSPLFEVMAEHADALADQNPRALLQVAEKLAACGLTAGALDAANQAVAAAHSIGAVSLHRAASRVVSNMLHGENLAEVSLLTRRELEVAQAAGARMRNKEIAQMLNVSTRTVENHLANVLRKLGVGSRDELAAALDDAGET